MDSVDLCYLPLADVAELLQRRAISPVDIARAVLDRAQQLQPTLNAFIHLEGEALLASARQAEQDLARDRARGPLHGIPLSLKDLFDVVGQPTTASSRICAERQPVRDSSVWMRLRAAGALLIGKTNLHEFAYGATTVNPHYGATRNPWRVDRMAGGSSGGSATAVAAGVGYASMGSDTGGSIRCPAALTGVTGLKPTYGRVSRAGMFPLAWALDHVGPLARTAFDCALVLDAIAGPDLADPTTLGIAAPRVAEVLRTRRADLRDIRVAVLVDHRAAVLDPDVGASFDRAVVDLVQLGAEVREVVLPEERAALDAGLLVLLVEAAAVHVPWLRERPDQYGADVRAQLELGTLVPAVDYIDAQRARHVLTRQILDRLAGVDVAVGPTVPLGALPIETTSGTGDHDADPRPALSRLTRVFDVTGQPAVSVPCGFTDEGLPIGLQIVSHPWHEALALRVAHAYQQVTDWHKQRPPID